MKDDIFTLFDCSAICLCIVLVGALSSTTFYYWRKYRRISKNMLLTDNEVITGDETQDDTAGKI